MRATRMMLQFAACAAITVPAVAQLPSAVRREALEWTDSSGVATRAIMWSPMATTKTLPTLVFSPGFGQLPASYSKLLSEWASRRFVVIAIEHPEFKDPNNMELYDASQAIARQLAASLHHILGEQQRPESPFARVDPTRIGFIGHSVGGSAAAQACSVEGQCRAAMNLDGTIFGPVVHRGLEQPFFLIRQRIPPPKKDDPPQWFEHRGQGTLHEDSVWTHTPTMYWLTVDGLDHMSFTDRGLDETRVEEFENALASRLSGKRTHEITTRYVEAFFGHYLSRVPLPLILKQTPFRRTNLRVRK